MIIQEVINICIHLLSIFQSIFFLSSLCWFQFYCCIVCLLCVVNFVQLMSTILNQFVNFVAQFSVTLHQVAIMVPFITRLHFSNMIRDNVCIAQLEFQFVLYLFNLYKIPQNDNSQYFVFVHNKLIIFIEQFRGIYESIIDYGILLSQLINLSIFGHYFVSSGGFVLQHNVISPFDSNFIFFRSLIFSLVGFYIIQV